MKVHELVIKDDYPVFKHAPRRLYARGSLSALQAPMVAVVGKRAATSHGMAMARRIGLFLSRLGVTVVSGLALGIDSAAHLGTLAAGGQTVAVLPCSVDKVIPLQNKGLAARILNERGLLVSEHPAPHRTVSRDFFMRNRIQSGLASASIVVECAVTGGTIRHARYAHAQGRPVLVVTTKRDVETDRSGGEWIIKNLGGVRVGSPQEIREALKRLTRLDL